ncbi:uncharacterized protein TRIADDRAFT_59840 [Trichoplax adhaerens]|uniref:3-oxo-5-alpha-steroid 4-dehydrogenase C-terminal domain-containing protein n=1 Tax=Trichoplax adhaerens TaxID=10228 RepID=B3S6K7_TRIAD|nr:hypothetical protein TRIADDRAFT_59840 [Trichoplax adhaerens]EDV21636.1 hypothetical protein TRIADDRAFT_59840 [Trichoplax adhaerens]|eukprot:XP_002115784.1 hypothetical protein TRIADDRAFT_59840 [Trichoplax adhaerens]
MAAIMNKITNFIHSYYILSPDQELDLLRNLAIGMFGLGACTLPSLMFLTAPYGRYTRDGFGYTINGKLMWFIQEMPSLLIPIIMLFEDDADQIHNLPNRILLGQFLLHYTQRTLIFPFLLRGGKPTPAMVGLMATCFCIYNGYLQGRYLTAFAVYDRSWLADPRFIIGGMFEYVSGANFFGEMLEWFGFSVACWSLPAAAFAFFAASNIGPRAYHHHRYYQKKFDDYPKERKAIIPFIF